MIMGFHGRKMKLFFITIWASIWCLVFAGTVPAAPPGSERIRVIPVASDKPAAGQPAATDRYVTIDFDDVDIAVFIKYISELTGKNFVVDKAVKGKVTIISPTKISAEEAYSVFESVLEVEGFTTVPAGSITKIVPAVEARSKSVETGLAIGTDQPADKVVTQLIPLKYASPEELKKVFAPLVSKTSVVISYTPTGMLIVTDVMSNIKRLQQIIKEIDVPAVGEEISVVLLQHASAVEIAKTLTTLFQQSSRAPRTRTTVPGRTVTPVATGEMSDIKIIPDERINGLIILASEDDTARIRNLLDLLDREVPKGEGDIKVYYLQNGDAEEMAAVLTALPTKQAGAEQKGTAPVISKDVQIVADKATNALVITAKKSDYLAIEDVIKQLDIPRRMVYLEALIMEVKVDKDFSLGVEWRGGFDIHGNYGVFGGSRSGQESNLDNLTATPPSIPRGLALGVLGETITVSGVEFHSISALLQAYKDDTDVHIISTPQILTTDNQEAQIQVGENVPYITSKNTTSGTQQDYTNYEYRDVGVTLKITPQINQEGVVRLKIFTEIIKLKDPDAATSTPTTLKRTADTTVIVQDLNTVVIGGIIGDDTQENQFKVPLLGDIPILGWLFKSKTTTRERTNLYIFLTPRIVRNPAEANAIYLEKKEDSERHREKGFGKPLQRKSEATDPTKLAVLGLRQLQAREFDKAKDSFGRVLLVNQDDPEALLHLGEVYEAEGNPALAVIMYEKVAGLQQASRAMKTIDPALQGRNLADVAKGNLERLQGKTVNPEP
jgi:general secretion pathway protein D